MKRALDLLLLEDDPEYVLLTRTFLAQTNDGERCRLHVAGMLEEGIARLRQGGIDVVLLDLMLPDSRGLATLDRILAVTPQAPVVVLTGLCDEQIALDAVGRGAQDYLVKATFDGKLLKRTLAYAVERSRLRSELENILENAADAMVVVDSGDVVRYVNPAAEAFFERKQEEWLGRPFGFPAIPAKTSEIRVGGRIAEMRVTRLQWKRYEASLASIRDITALRRVEQLRAEIRERRRMDHLKDELMSTVSHELRSPLTVIKAAVANLLEGLVGDLPEPQRRLVALAYRNVERLAKIINNLLDLSRLEADQVRVQKSKVDVSALVKEAAQGFSLTRGDKAVTIDVRLPEHLPPVAGDGDLLAQVLSNLLDNALRFAHTRVAVAAEPVASLAAAASEGRGSPRHGAAVADRPGVQITVEDDGEGIPGERLGELFNKFVQVGRPSGGAGYKGTGLGLAICKEIIQRHEGRIWAESEPGRGARFKFVLPTPEDRWPRDC